VVIWLTARVVRQGDKQATRLTKEYDGIIHPPQKLTNEEIEAILEYAEGVASLAGSERGS
jgi:hypothetical protein